MALKDFTIDLNISGTVRTFYFYSNNEQPVVGIREVANTLGYVNADDLVTSNSLTSGRDFVNIQAYNGRCLYLLGLYKAIITAPNQNNAMQLASAIAVRALDEAYVDPRTELEMLEISVKKFNTLLELFKSASNANTGSEVLNAIASKLLAVINAIAS